MNELAIFVLKVLLSDAGVVVAIVLPLALLLINFVFGSCVVSEALSTVQTGSSENIHTYSRRIGRGLVVVILLTFFWQYFGYFHQVHSSWNGKVYQCSPLDGFLESLLSLVRGSPVVQVPDLMVCRWEDIIFLCLWTLFLVLYVAVIVSSPSKCKRLSESMLQTTKGNSNLSYCRRCSCVVEDMDHHCYAVCNCVGGGNRKLFLLLLGTAVAELSFLLLCCLPSFRYLCLHDLFSAVGLILVCVVTILLSALFCFHCFLWKRGITTKRFLKAMDHGILAAFNCSLTTE